MRYTEPRSTRDRLRRSSQSERKTQLVAARRQARPTVPGVRQEHVRRSSLARLIVVASVLLLVASGFPAFTSAQESSDPLQVDLVPVGDATVSGLALLSPSGDVTAVQLLVMGAVEGTAAMIHRGTCDDIHPAPIALLGDVGAAGQIQTTAPVPYATLTSGGYLIALHTGLSELASAVAC